MEGMKDCGPAKAKAKKVMEKKILKSVKSEPAAGEQLWAAEIPASSLGKALSTSSRVLGTCLAVPSQESYLIA